MHMQNIGQLTQYALQLHSTLIRTHYIITTVPCMHCWAGPKQHAPCVVYEYCWPVPNQQWGEYLTDKESTLHPTVTHAQWGHWQYFCWCRECYVHHKGLLKVNTLHVRIVSVHVLCWEQQVGLPLWHCPVSTFMLGVEYDIHMRS